MGKIVISENISLDGVVQDPTGEEGFKHGGWFSQIGDKDREEWARVEFEEALGAEALLLGRRSDEYFGPRWTGRSGEWADRLNILPKYVVSSTLEDPKWTNVTVLNGDVVDELRLMVYPFVLGAGERLFGETSAKKPIRPLSARTVGDSLVFLTYAVVRDA
jgi:dihydrofolate reductase